MMMGPEPGIRIVLMVVSFDIALVEFISQLEKEIINL
jgi:hypothetical protein